MQLFQNKKEELAARRLQKRFKAALQRARDRLKAKKLELKMLLEKEKEAKRQRSELEESEMYRIYTLQEELHQKTSEMINKRLLIRPNTVFVVTWRCLFVLAVIFEITQLALGPWMAKYEDKNGDPLRMESFLEEAFIPSPVSMLPECIPPKAKNGLAGLIAKIFASRSPDAVVMPKPWYCESVAYSRLLNIYSVSVSWFIRNFFDVLGVICFLDVFITFFEGEYDPETGFLEPAPFFQRWILPGILLQLMVNPRMETTYNIVSWTLHGCLRHGPFRVLRWTAAFFFPLSRFLLSQVKRAWMRLVRFENRTSFKRRDPILYYYY